MPHYLIFKVDQVRISEVGATMFISIRGLYVFHGFPWDSTLIWKSMFEHSKKETPVLGNAIPVLSMKLKRGQCVFWQFFNIDLCSATSIESSCRDLLIDQPEHWPILKNNLNTYHPPFWFHTQNRYSIPQNGV